MNPRVQKALDGDIDRGLLPLQQQAELAETEAVIGAVLRAIPDESLPDLSAGVLARLEAGQAIRRPMTTQAERPATTKTSRRFADWLWRPRAVSIGWRPAYALAAGIVLAAILTTQALRSDRAVPATSQQVFTQFVLKAPNATRVALAGDFTGWQPTVTMTRAEAGVWTVVVPLTPGIHQYSFVVDGERWIPDPAAPAVADGFGGMNSRVAVLTPDERSL